MLDNWLHRPIRHRSDTSMRFKGEYSVIIHLPPLSCWPPSLQRARTRDDGSQKLRR